MAASLDLNETLQAILENVEKLMPAEFMEVTVWDRMARTLFRTALPGLMVRTASWSCIASATRQTRA
jgi:hypothetical protein